MLDIFKQFATDETLENAGTWVEYGDVKFLVGRTGNRKYVKSLSQKVEANKSLLDKEDKASEALSDKIMVEVLAESVLLGWEGEVAYKGEALSYSAENAAKLLAVKDFRRLVVGWADDFARFKVKLTEDQAKN